MEIDATHHAHLLHRRSVNAVAAKACAATAAVSMLSTIVQTCQSARRKCLLLVTLLPNREKLNHLLSQGAW
jgi:hypothetical protein